MWTAAITRLCQRHLYLRRPLSNAGTINLIQLPGPARCFSNLTRPLLAAEGANDDAVDQRLSSDNLPNDAPDDGGNLDSYEKLLRDLEARERGDVKMKMLAQQRMERKALEREKWHQKMQEQTWDPRKSGKFYPRESESDLRDLPREPGARVLYHCLTEDNPRRAVHYIIVNLKRGQFFVDEAMLNTVMESLNRHKLYAETLKFWETLLPYMQSGRSIASLEKKVKSWTPMDKLVSDPDVHSYVHIVRAIGKNHSPQKAKLYVRSLDSKGFSPTFDVYAALYQLYMDEKRAVVRTILEKIKETFGISKEFYELVIEANLKRKDGETAEKFLEEWKNNPDIAPPDAKTFRILLRGYYEAHYFRKAKELYDLADAEGIELQPEDYKVCIDSLSLRNQFRHCEEVFNRGKECKNPLAVYTAYIKACVLQKKISEAKSLAEQYITTGLPLHVDLFNPVVEYLGNVGDIDEASKLIETADEYGLILSRSAYSTVLAASLEKNDGILAAQLTTKMQGARLWPPTVTFYNRAVRHFAKMKAMRRLGSMVREMRGWNMPLSTEICNVILKTYGEARRIRKMHDFLDYMKTQEPSKVDTETYHILIKNYSQHGILKEAKNCLEQMKEAELPITVDPYFDILEGYASRGFMKHCGKIVEEIENLCDGQLPLRGFEILLDGYGRCRDLEAVDALIETIKTRGLETTETTWKHIILAYGRCGRLNKAKTAFESSEALFTSRDSSRELATAYLEALSYAGEPNDCLDFFERHFTQKKLTLDGEGFGHIIRSLACGGYLGPAKRWMAKMHNEGLTIQPAQYEALMRGYGGAKKTRKAINLLNKLKKQKFLYGSSTIQAFLESFQGVESAQTLSEIFWTEAKEVSLYVTDKPFEILMNAFLREGDTLQALNTFDRYCAYERDFVYLPARLGMLLVRCYLFDDLLGFAEESLEEICKRGTTSTPEAFNDYFNTLLRPNSAGVSFEPSAAVRKAELMFDRMLAADILPDSLTFELMITACLRAKDRENAEKYYRLCLKDGEFLPQQILDDMAKLKIDVEEIRLQHEQSQAA